MIHRILLVLLMLGMGACGDGTGPEPLIIDVSDFVYPGVTWRLGSGYSRVARATGGNGDYTWSIESGSLPPGLSLEQRSDGDVELIGTLTTLGVFPFTLSVFSSRGRHGGRQTGQEALSITVTQFLEPSESCSNNDPVTSIVLFEDHNLWEAVRAALSDINITCDLASALTDLTAQNAGINSIVGIQNLTGLTTLDLKGNLIIELSTLKGLTNLTDLRLDENANLIDIQPLLDNTGLGAGDMVNLSSTNVSCSDVDALRATGVVVTSSCP